MKNFTLIVAAMLLVPAAGMAQRWRGNAAGGQSRSIVMTDKAKQNAPLRSAKKAAEDAVMMPTRQECYAYDNGSWTLRSTSGLTFDDKGNLLTQTDTAGTTVTKDVYEYNANGMETSLMEYVSKNGGEFENNFRRLKTYDSRVTDFVVSCEEYDWDSDWVLQNGDNTFKKEITRNDDGLVTATKTENYRYNKYILSGGSAITYGEDGKATRWESKRPSGYGGLTTYISFDNIVWEQTDGQILAVEYADLFSGNNRVSSATYYDTEGGVRADVVATYGENGSYSYYMQPQGYDERDVYTRTADDNYGSYTLTADYYSDLNGDGEYTDDEIDFSDKTVVTYDEHGFLTSEVYYSDDEPYSGVKYEYTYEADFDYPTETICYEYSTSSGEFEKKLKYVSSGFVNVATGIKTTNGNSDAATQAVYNLQGVKVAASASQLPAGIYIVKNGNQTKKVAVK